MTDLSVPDRQAGTFSLVPQSMAEAMKLAELIASSDLAPKDYKGKPGNVLIAVQMGQEVGLAPMSAIQNIAVINGKPGLYGDAGKAVLHNRGFIIEEDDINVIKKTGTGRCRIIRPGHPPCERTFSIDNAKTAGLWGKAGPWTQYPERQLAWRAFWFAARDIASDVLKGLHGMEEARDIERDITPSDFKDSGKPAIPAGYTDEKFKANLPAWTKLIKDGKKTSDQIIAIVSTKGSLSDEQKAVLTAIKKDAAPVITYAKVADKLNAAKDADELETAAELIGEVDDPEQRKELSAIYVKLKDGQTEGAE